MSDGSYTLMEVVAPIVKLDGFTVWAALDANEHMRRVMLTHETSDQLLDAMEEEITQAHAAPQWGGALLLIEIEFSQVIA